MITKELKEKIARYRAVMTEEEAIVLARTEGYPETQIQTQTPGWLQHYHNTALTLQVLRGI